MRGSWLGKRTRQLPQRNRKDVTLKSGIRNFFADYFRIEQVEFGKFGNGLPDPEDLFNQFKNDCNVIVTTSLFLIAIGYTTLPRFDQISEQALFCRLHRLHKSQEPLPTHFCSILPPADFEKHLNIF